MAEDISKCKNELTSDDGVYFFCEQRKKREEKSIAFPQKDLDEKKGLNSWLRFGVRWIDYVVFFLMIRISVLKLGGFPNFFEGSGIAFFLKLYLTIPLEAFFICLLGTTPGKWLGNISVRDLGGGKTRYLQALQRTLWVWVRGLGLGIPLVNLVLMWFARKKLIKDGITWWDEVAGTKVEYMEIPLWRHILVLIFAVALFLLINISIIDYVLYVK